MSVRTTGLLRKTDHRILAAVLLAFATTSCSGASTSIVGASGLSEPASMQATSGDAQTGTVGATLPDPISVQVTTKSGKAVSGASVDWSFANGTGSTTQDGTGAKTLTTVTDKSGVTSVYWTLDTIAGDQQATATLEGASSFHANFHSHGKPSKPSSIDISPSSVTLTVGQPMLLSATVLDKWGNLISGATVAWQSGDSVVAVVDSTGLVTGEAAGKDTITAIDGSASGHSSVIVTATRLPSVAKVTADSQTVTLTALGATARLSATASDSSGATVQGATFNWTTLNSSVATVDSTGLVVAVKNGTTSVIVSAVGSAAADTVAVTVSQQAAKITVSPDSLDLRVGQTAQLTATVADKNGNKIAGANVAWASSDSSVASVSQSGQVSARSTGTATVSASSGGIKAQAPVTVSGTAQPAVSSVVLSPDSLSFTALGGTATLTAKALDSLGNQVTGASISWSSTNPGVASVDQGGVVTSKGWGQAFIVATAVCCSVSDTAAVTVQQPVTSQPTTGYYGEVFNADGLANLEIGLYTGRKLDIRFRAQHSGNLSEIRFLLAFNPGYYAGDGGQVRVEVQSDDGTSNHDPSGTVLATSNTLTNPMSTNYPTVQFSPPAPITAGKLYHLVFWNPSADPVHNYVSLDNLWVAAGGPNMQPTISDTDLAVLWKYSGSSAWAVNDTKTPVVDIHFSDGFAQGQGYVDALSSSGAFPITNTAFVRERFTVTGSDKTVSSVSVRIRSTSGTGQAIVRLEQGDGTLIEQGSITAGTSYAWHTLRFQSPHTLSAGSTYDVVVSAPTGNSLSMFVLQEGTAVGFRTPAIFTDGGAQYYNGSWHDAISSFMDFQLYFTLTGT